MNSILKWIIIFESLAAVYSFEPVTMFALGSAVTSIFIATVAVLAPRPESSNRNTAQNQKAESSNRNTAQNQKAEPSNPITVLKRDAECSEDYYIERINKNNLEQNLNANVFGQEYAIKRIVKIVNSTIKERETPLVMSFHGPTGTGKSYVFKIVANALFKNGTESKFVHFIYSQINYAVCTPELLPKIKTDLLDFIKNHNEKVGNQDYRKSIFIFLSNIGDDMIINRLVNHYKNKNTRETIPLTDIENSIPNIAAQSPGGFKNSKIISKSSISLYVPFLPLERKHVQQCAKKELEKRKIEANSNNLNIVANEMIYDQYKYFSTQGCKLIQSKVVTLW
ncbi:torsin-1A-like [Hydra vulgaris]|uniref:Torsin-1A-like n=1 Tax=Hydra vulgaris TaxID=6087 RepID=A0ABM4DFG6_HYDVU